MWFGRETAQRVGLATLLWLWIGLVLYAARNVGYMGDTIPTIGYVGILLFSALVPRKLLRTLIVFVALLTLLKWEYYQQAPWLQPWVFAVALWRDMSVAVHSAWTGDDQFVTDGVRTLAFLGVITFATRLLEEVTMRPFLVVFMTALGEFALIDLAAVYRVRDASEIVLFLLVGLLILLWLHLSRLHLVSKVPSYRDMLWLIAAPAGLVAALALLGLALPKGSAHWPTSNVFAQASKWMGGAAQGNGIYGLNDDALGGPFNGSRSVFLRVLANRPSYYRGEALSTYTGTGWIASPAHELPVLAGKPIASSIWTEVGPDAKDSAYRLTQRIQVITGHYPVLFGGYQIVQVDQPGARRVYELDLSKDSLSAGTLHPGDSYRVTSEVPAPSREDLTRVNDSNLAYSLPADLQLPGSLPTRVAQLAWRITAGKQGTYAKVEAIIAYLQKHETYDTQDIPFVRPGQDFVDQFLFVTHRGYCDHFSSSLAVLARVVGIPTRWVKGFAAVSANPRYHGFGQEYDVRGTDAHSWVEVWFAGYGWIPFEPTPSFVLPAPPRVAQAAQPRAATEHPRSRQSGASPQTSRGGFAKGRGATAMHGHTGEIVLLMFAGLALIGLVALGWYQRIRKHADRQLTSSFERELGALLKRFLSASGQRRPDQTLREYVSQQAHSETAMRFVLWYEGVCYGAERRIDALSEGKTILRGVTRAKRMPGNVSHSVQAADDAGSSGTSGHL